MLKQRVKETKGPARARGGLDLLIGYRHFAQIEGSSSVKCALARWACARRCAFTLFICITAFFFGTGHLSGQELAPDVRIDVDFPSVLGFSADGAYLLISVSSDQLRRYNLTQRRFDSQLAFANPYWASGRFGINSDGSRLVGIDYVTSEIQVTDVESGDVLYTLPTPRKQHRSVADHPELTFAGDDDRLIVWKAVDHLSVADISSATWTTLSSVDFLAVSDSSCLTVVGDLFKVIAFHCESGPVHRAFHRLGDLSLSRDGDTLFVREVNTDYEDVLHVLDSQALTPLGEPWAMQHYTDTYRYLDNAWLDHRPIVLYEVGDPGDRILTVLDVRERSIMLSLRSAQRQGSVVLSSDGRWLARDYGANVVEVYSLGRASAPRSGPAMLPRLVPQIWHSGPLSGLSVSEDGRIVAIGGADGWVSLWDRGSGLSFRRLLRESSRLALSHGGLRMLITDLIGGSSVWDVGSGELLQNLPWDLFGNGNVFATFLADDTRTLLCQWHDKCTVRALSEDHTSYERDSEGVVWGMPLYGVSLQLFKDGSRDYDAMPLLPEEGTLSDYYYHAVSLAPDERSVAVALGEEGVGWMELTTEGRQRVITTIEDVEVTAVAAVDDDRVVAGLSNGEVRLIDALTGETLYVLPTRNTDISAIIRLDNERIAVASYGHTPPLIGGRRDESYRAEILLISHHDFAVLDRLVLNRNAVDDLAASGDGRWVVSVSQPHWYLDGEEALVALVQIWDTETAQVSAELESHVLETLRIEFDNDSDYLLADSHGVASLWNLKDGNITQQFHHQNGGGDPALETYATLIDDTVFYVPNVSEGRDGLKSWSTRTGIRDLTVPVQIIEYGDSFDTLSVDGSRIGVKVDWSSLVLFSVDERDQQFLRIERDHGVTDYILYADAELVLLNLGRDGIEALSASSGASMWRRDDFLDPGRYETHAVRLMPTVDDTGHTGVVVTTGDDRLLVLDVVDGERRLMLENDDSGVSVPVIDEDVARGVLRMTDDYRIERLSMQDGSVIESATLGITSLEYAVSDRTGNVYLVADGYGQVVLWDRNFGTHTVFASEAVGPESVSFSPDGRVLAIVETDGIVGLWDVSRGPAGLQRLARLITFADGDWAVVGEDGRYDASDPADLEGLAWVMPDAPTEPVPLSVFYRDYYEPRLLPRLLAGETFPEIRSIANLDRKQPRVEITSIEPAGPNRVNVTVEVRKGESDGVGDLKLFRDGRLIGLDGSAQRAGGNKREGWQMTFRDIALPTRSRVESVEFSAYAFNGDGVKSDTHRLEYELPEAEPQSRRAFVVVVGVNAYENRSWDLHYAAEDARASGDLITQYLLESGDFDEVRTVSLIAEREDNKIVGSATRGDLLAVLDVLGGQDADVERLRAIPGADSLAKATPDDLVYLAISGHGLSGDNGLFHLFLSDIGEGSGRVVDEALLEHTLDSDLLASHLRPVDAGDFVMVIDACNAAASVEGGGFKPGPMGSRGLGQLAYDKAMRVLAASQAEAVALESGDLRHGLLTYAMLREGLAGGAADRAPEDRWIELGEVLAYGVERVPLLYEATQGWQLRCARARPNGVQTEYEKR